MAATNSRVGDVLGRADLGDRVVVRGVVRGEPFAGAGTVLALDPGVPDVDLAVVGITHATMASSAQIVTPNSTQSLPL
jgi:hypothetical protein